MGSKDIAAITRLPFSIVVSIASIVLIVFAIVLAKKTNYRTKIITVSIAFTITLANAAFPHPLALTGCSSFQRI